MIHLFIAVVFSMAVFSCDKDELIMSIDENEVVMASGASRSILIKGGLPEFFVISKDEEIVKASITDDMLIINAKQTGETTLTLIDANSSILIIPIVVFPYSNQTILDIDSLYVNTVIANKEVKRIVENELNNNAPFSIGTRYILGFKAEDPGSLLILHEGSDQIIEGTFNIEKVEERLNYHFIYDGKHLTYQIGIVDLPTKTSLDAKVWISLIEDYTEFYQNIYPDAGIEEVFRMQLALPETINLSDNFR